MVLWVRHFLGAQGFEVTDNVIYQDNQSTMLLARNGKQSSGKKTRHIEIRYYFITDQINQKKARVEYCPTGDMIADFFTKPLQGSVFRWFRAVILNLPPPVAEQECVATCHMSKSDESRVQAKRPARIIPLRQVRSRSYADVARVNVRH
jgi:hypothetical protein